MNALHVFTPSKLRVSLIFLIIVGLILFFIKGQPGQPLAFQNDFNTSVGGPFESTNSNSRYALVVAMVEQGSFFLTEQQARFAAPDIIRYNGQFLSIFNPGMSLVAVPFYWLGKQWGIPQLLTFLSNSLLAVCNVVVLYHLARRAHISRPLSILVGMIFLFSTNALAYSQTLTQHHGSTFLILIGLLIATARPHWLSNTIFGVVCGVGLLFDFPNLFLLFPLGVAIVVKHFQLTEKEKQYHIKFNLAVVTIAVGLLPLVAVYGWYNLHTTGSLMTIAQFLGRSDYFDTEAKKEEHLLQASKRDEYESTMPFNTRLQLNGLTVLLVSNERSWVYFSPVLLMGLVGIVWGLHHSHHKKLMVLILSVVATNIMIYSAFGDPWGGWSFGPRYLMPSAALMSLAVGLAMQQWIRRWWFLLPLILLMGYSLIISTAGALTSAAIPPKQEAESLINNVPYTSQYNFDFINRNQSSSLLFNSYFSQTLSAFQYYQLVTIMVGAAMLSMLGWAIVEGREGQ